VCQSLSVPSQSFPCIKRSRFLTIALQAVRSRVWFPMWSSRFFIDFLSVCSMVLVSTQYLTDMSIRDLPWGGGG
jgi:hypothetical protein